jgi:hypothetical protein
VIVAVVDAVGALAGVLVGVLVGVTVEPFRAAVSRSMQLRCCGRAAVQLAWMLEVAHDWEGAGSGDVAWRSNHLYDQ